MSSYSQGNSVPLGGNIVNSNEDNNISACKQYIEFIIKGWEDDDYLEIRALENNKVKLNIFYRIGEMKIDEVCDLIKQKLDIYVGVLPREKKCGRDECIKKGNLLWADHDFHNDVSKKPSLEEEKNYIFSKLDIYPTLLVDSGRGYHIYFKLEEFIDIKTIRGINEKIANALGSDPQVINPSRIMRLPGSYNRKADKNAEIVMYWPYQTYSAKKLIDSLNKNGKQKESDNIENRNYGLIELEGDKINEIAELFKEFYVKGVRNSLVLGISGFLLFRKISPISAVEIIKKLHDETNDEESLKTRLSPVVYTYEKAGINLKSYEIKEVAGVDPYGLNKDIKEENVSWRHWLLDFVPQVLGNKTKMEEAIKRADEIIGKIQNGGAEEEEKDSNYYRSLIFGESIDWDSLNYSQRLENLKNMNSIEDKLSSKEEKVTKPSEMAKKLAEVFVKARLFVPAVARFDGEPTYGSTLEYGFITGRLFKDEEELKRVLRIYLSRAAPSYSVIQLFNTALEQLKSYGNDVFGKINPLQYVNHENCAVDLNNLECTNTGYFTYEFPPIDLQFLKKLKNGEIKEDYFKDKAFYKIIRNHYKQREWKKLLDALGAILTPFSLRLITIVKGDKNTRKTFLMNLLTTHLSSFVSPINLTLLQNNRFGLQHALSARLLVSSEEKGTIIHNVEYIKSLIGGDNMPIDIKFKPPVTLKENPFKMMIFTNDLPVFKNKDEALIDRIQIIYTTNSSERTNKEIELMREATNDRKSFIEFIYWCYWRLKNKEYKIVGKGTEEVYYALVEAESSAYKFFKEKQDILIVKEGAMTKGTELYDKYTKWCAEKKEKAVGRNTFYDNIIAFYGDKGVVKTQKNRTEVWFRNLNLTKA
ncbi:MAG: DUF5906 domain-containing protein [Caldisphaera sp.]